MVRAQFLRYVLVGVGLNAALYGTYLLLTWWILGSETAMTITFSVGVLLGFLTHRRVTFRHRGHGFTALRRFLACYAILYLVNFIALWVFADRMGIPHQLVQGCMALVVALVAFFVQKHWVFPDAAATEERIATRTNG
jgi:putative flippase GtrA